jgi:predicted hydrocarbon binding protein
MLNSFFDKYIFTGTLKYTHSNFFLVDVPFVIAPTNILMGIASEDDFEFQKKIYLEIKKGTRDYFLQKVTDLGIDKQRQLKFVEEFFIGSGWGDIQVVDLNNESKRAIIVVDNSPFVAALKGKTKIECDVFIRGVFAGLFSRIFDTAIECVEVECAALNAERCKFIVKPKSEFDFSNETVQRQLPLED